MLIMKMRCKGGLMKLGMVGYGPQYGRLLVVLLDGWARWLATCEKKVIHDFSLSNCNEFHNIEYS